MKTHQMRVKDFFDNNATQFDSLYEATNPLQRLLNRILRKSVTRRFQKTIEECKPIEGRSVLDIGCGTGRYGVSLAAAGADYVLGVDFAEKMIKLAQRKAIRHNVSDKCKFKVADFANCDFDRKFDYVVAMGFMDYVDAPEAVIMKVRTITAVKAMFSFPASQGLLAWQRKIRYRHKCPLYLYKQDQIRRLFADVDDKKLRIESISRDYYVTLRT